MQADIPKKELVIHFNTMEKGFVHFIDYIESSILMDKASLTIH
jgi:hypothetical protein